MPYLLVIPKVNLPFPLPDKLRLLYYDNKMTDLKHLCIALSVVLNILAIAYRNRYPNLFCYYKIITHFWFIQSLTKMLWKFIKYYTEYLTLQTKKYLPYDSPQSIELSPISFYILTLDFNLILFWASMGFNALMLVTCKFIKCITLIEEIDIVFAK